MSSGRVVAFKTHKNSSFADSSGSTARPFLVFLRFSHASPPPFFHIIYAQFTHVQPLSLPQKKFMPSRPHVYRAILSQPVDPTLFGRRGGYHANGNDPHASSLTSNPPVILAASQLARIQTRSMLQTDAELQDERDRSNCHLQEQKAAAQERKAKMLALAALAEEQHRANEETNAAAIACRARTYERRDEELDMCKYLRGLAAQAEVCVLGWEESHVGIMGKNA